MARSAEIEAIARGLDELGWQANRVVVATGFWRRALGLIGLSWRMRRVRGTGRTGEGTRRAHVVMVFPRCSSVHTFFMGCSIDIAFIGRDGAVLQVHGEVGPGRVLRASEALAVIERI